MLTRLSKVRFISLAISILMVFMSFSTTAAAPLLASPGDVIINEIIQNPSAVYDSAGEWFELYNPTTSDIDIDGWTIFDNDIDSHVIENGGPLLIPAGGYLVLGNNTDFATNGGVDVAYSYGSGWYLSNSADEVVLLDATLTEIDRVEYDGGAAFPDPTGASMALLNPALDNNVGANWCEASTPYGDGDLGTPGAANDCPIVIPEIVINEIIQNPSAVYDSAGEWFELYNPTTSDIDIDGWTIFDNDIDSHVIDNGGPLMVPAGGYLVIGNNTDSSTNGGVDVAYNYGSGWYLSNGADEVVLLDTLLTEIDRVEYDGGAVFPDPTGASMALINPALDNNVGVNWCTASTPYGAGDLGTPGAANDCPIVIPEIVINEIIQNPSAVYDSAGEWFELYNPTTSDIDIDGWTIKDNDSDSHVIDNGGPLLIPAGGYLVLGNNTDFATNGGVDVAYSYGSGWYLSNGADEVVLLDVLITEIDRVEYDGGAVFPDPTGASMALINPVLDNNVGANWCEAGTPYGDGDLGTPGAANDCPIVVPEIVINEIIQNPSAVYDSAGEWFELYNPTTSDIDIDGWTIKDNDSDSHVIDNGGPLLIPAGGYLVLGNNTDFATNGGVDVAYSYGSGWYLSNGADEVVLLDVLITEIDRVEYDGGAVFPDPTGASMALLNPALDNNVGANWCTASTSYGAGDLGTPGAANDCPAPECNDPFTPVFEIQGDGFTAAITGPITTQGVVIGDFEGLYPALRGFYIQDINGDGDPATSDGLFIFNGNNDSVEVGQIVRVDGSAGEYYEQTQISSVTSIAQCGTASVDPTPISLPIPSTDYLERFEGMIVTFPQTLYISEYFNFDRYGEIVLTPQRQLQPTAIYEPGSPQADAMAQENLLSRITLDDGRTNQNPDPAVHPNGGIFDLTNRFRGGDKLDAVTGVMDYRYDLYRIQPTQGAMYTPMNPRTGQPADVGGDLKVANFNVLNYFTTLNSRGANTPEEFVRQRDKIFAALEAIDADIVGLIEIENNGTAVQDLVQGLNAWIGSPIYSYVDTGLIGDDAITVAFIYKPSVVELVGDFEALVDSTFTDPLNYGEQKNRPALAQTFHSIQDDATFTVVVNHFKSKGSECGPGDDDLVQGSCNLTRMLAAQALVDWLATDPTGSLDPDFLVIGDLNAYDKEDPIDVLVGAGYTDIVRQFEGENAYTYVYDGQLGYLDHALSNPNLTPRITGVDTWHINADEPDILDYDMSYKQDAQDALYESNAYRSSDHDPVIVGLVPNEAPVCEAAYASVDLLWPVNHKFVSIEILGVIDGDGHELTITIDSIFQDEQVDENGDGSTAPDAIIGDDGTFELRAERVGDGNGRVYHIFFTADDGYGGSCLGEVLVSVPHDSGKKAEPPVDDGALFDSTVEPDPEAIEEAGVEPTPEPMPAPTEEPDVALTPEPTEAPDDKDKKDK